MSHIRKRLTRHNMAPYSMISEDDGRKAIRDLPDAFRLVAVLSLPEGFSYRKIADIVGINLKTVGSRLHQGLMPLQRQFFDQCEVRRQIRFACRQSQEDRFGFVFGVYDDDVISRFKRS